MKIIKYLILVIPALLAGSCSDSDTVLQPLNAKFLCDRTVLNPGETVNFMDQSEGAPARWDWTFEGGEPATSQLTSPEVTYASPGKYAVTLRVGRGTNNSEIVLTDYIIVSVPDEIIPDFTSDKVQASNIESVTFTDTSTGFPSSWEWTFVNEEGLTLTSTEQNPTMQFEPGIYTVSLKAINEKTEAVVTKESYLTVIDIYSVGADFNIVSDYRILEGESVQFEDASVGTPIAWKWEFEGGSPAISTEQNPKVTYNTTGIYKVKLTVSSAKNESVCEKDGVVLVIPVTGLELYLPFEGDFNDLSGNGYRVVEVTSGSTYKVNADGPSRHEGKKCASFQGESKNSTTDYSFLSVLDGDKLPGGLDSHTIAFWVCTSNNSQVQTILQRGLSKGAIEGNTDGTNQYWFRMDTNTAGLRFYRVITGTGNQDLVDKTADYRDGEWHFVVYTQSTSGTSTTMTLYVDGEQTVTNTKAVELDTTKNPFYIGSQTQLQNGSILSLNHMQGYIDDFMIYNYSFTAKEVQCLYDLTK